MGVTRTGTARRGHWARRGAMLLVAAGMAGAVAACGSSDDGSAAASESSSVAVPASGALSGQWRGDWQVDGKTTEAHLLVVGDDPFLATLDVQGACGATWTQKSRDGDTVTVDTTVTYGQCRSQPWTLTVGPTTITATDGQTSVEFTRS
ncbi:hypothetical protein [Gordonia sp. NB41Y]|uniref:hypothetical protein n=1 Tax=Gordonia sp. NB41Y TaxID=875808 RepID=UPI00273AB37F|nr:hypothetical protein [Gordonia sp. NB41Y]WLP91914.1 hypothetical protein Q9K23_06625 [Gordonia sp. NB41Y]